MLIHPTKASFVSCQSPSILGDITDEHISVATWQRDAQAVIQDYIQSNAKRLSIGLRFVSELTHLRETLASSLPKGNGQQALIDDIYLLSDMLTCLFDCDSVGLRLVVMDSPMCPKFHYDNIPVRLVCTYLGEGTQWLPRELGNRDDIANKVIDKSEIGQSSAYDVSLLKGEAWSDTPHQGVIHRSSPMQSGQIRALLTLDPL